MIDINTKHKIDSMWLLLIITYTHETPLRRVFVSINTL